MRKSFNEEHLYGLALYMIPNIRDGLSKQLLSYAGSAEEIFKMSKTRLQKIPGIGPLTAGEIFSSDTLHEAEEELKFIDKNKIDILFYYDERYPQRLLNCSDSPFVLFAKGRYDFNVSKVISIIGTRHATEYGRWMTESIVDRLGVYDFTLVSGLAFGIDIAAHRAALNRNLQNIGVLGHGLDRIYPFQHTRVAEQMQEHGALLTDFTSGTKPDKVNFPKRNRIVAGMTDATIVVESAISGGALITAEIANSYNREVFAVPGKVNDEFSLGCNELVRQNKAQLITSAEDIAKALSWDLESAVVRKEKSAPSTLFPDLQGDELLVYSFIKEKIKVHLDVLTRHLPLKAGALPAVLLQLEMQGWIQVKPGNIYSVV